MRTTLSLFLTSTALAAAIALPAASATRALDDGAAAPLAAQTRDASDAPLLIVASDDDHRREGARRGRDDDDDDEDDDDEDEDDDDEGGGRRAGVRDPAPAGAAAPPANGLFGTGAPPRVQVN